MIPLFSDSSRIPVDFQGAVVSVGNFDGVHRGHAKLVGKLVELSLELNRPAMIVTFDRPPNLILRPEIPLHSPLTTIRQRADLLGELGVSAALALNTSHQLLGLTAMEFYSQVLVGQLRMSGMVEGPNFRFGKDRLGDVGLLAELCLRDGMPFQVVNAVGDTDGMVSSSRIRNLLTQGLVVEAAEFLGRTYELSGVVERGAGRGTGLGFPTANLGQIATLVPGHGVYAASVHWSGKTYRAAINIGPNPTFGETQTKVEVHVLDFHEEIYEQTLRCKLIGKVRDVVKFQNKQQLLEQIASDIEVVRKLVSLAANG